MSAQSHLVTVAPPAPAPDLIQSALLLPLSLISLDEHRGKKIRTIGQILSYNPSTSLLLLSAPHAYPTDSVATLYANVSVPLMGASPALKDMYETHREGDLGRPRLKFERGEWMCVVGWLEMTPSGGLPEAVRAGYEPPLPGVVLDLIHVSPAKEPPQGAYYRGSVG
ncbi:uncharacterized protein MKK02DRAFT_44008 [Dioszegia hungarica]|uniref:Uncharacterized protein n=1 Tax=Dioszegia hungarica TaxID=4972 RepID=A0AA38LS27_9TREE|nr:uncharacterized protein MKK02DRAFT_44008 [Dioszegia hungarica]KAI9635322.1 hypothetical protein MKK02DRAFT_44008 [Dioszegia hungarica]